MKKLLIFLAALLLASSCATNIRFELPQGPAGRDGKSAYEMWLDAINDGTIKWTRGTNIENFFLYQKGEKGSDGASAYEVWLEYIATGNADDPHNPGSKWAKSRNTITDFWVYLTGQKGAQGPAGPQGPVGPQGPAGQQGPTGEQGPAGEQGIDGNNGNNGNDGMSAYDWWVDWLTKEYAAGRTVLDPHGNGTTDLWPVTKNSPTNFLEYLTGQTGAKGDTGEIVQGLVDVFEVWSKDADAYNKLFRTWHVNDPTHSNHICYSWLAMPDGSYSGSSVTFSDFIRFCLNFPAAGAWYLSHTPTTVPPRNTPPANYGTP